MKVITIYGEIEGPKIYSDGQVYSLEKDSLVYPRTKGWFQLKESGRRWKLIRMLRKSRAEVYPHWDNE
nr:MAG TPA: hypothetical protein [Bacteriophage sp.]